MFIAANLSPYKLDTVECVLFWLLQPEKTTLKGNMSWCYPVVSDSPGLATAAEEMLVFGQFPQRD